MQLTAFMLYCFFGLPCCIVWGAGGMRQGRRIKSAGARALQSPHCAETATVCGGLQGDLQTQPCRSGERTAATWRQQGGSCYVTAMVREGKDGSTEELVAARAGPGEPSVMWTGLSSFPAAVTCRGAGHAALTGRSKEGAHVSEGAQTDEKAPLIHSNGRRSRVN